MMGDRLSLDNSGVVVLDLNGVSLEIGAPERLAAIRVPVGATLVIQNTAPNQAAQITAYGGTSDVTFFQGGSGAGIGGDGGSNYQVSGESAGTIIVLSGTVVAHGGDANAGDSYGSTAAGIGGGSGGSNAYLSDVARGGDLTAFVQSGGIVSANGGDTTQPAAGSGAGIGGGASGGYGTSGGCGEVIISGGNLHAEGGSTSASLYAAGGASIGRGGHGVQGFLSSSVGTILVQNPAAAAAPVGKGFVPDPYGQSDGVGTVGATLTNGGITSVGASVTMSSSHDAAALTDPAMVDFATTYVISTSINGVITAVPGSPFGYGQLLAQPTIPAAQAGYSFSGWRIGGLSGPQAAFPYAITQPTVLVATWQAPAAVTLSNTGLDAKLIGLVAFALIVGGLGVAFVLRRRIASITDRPE